MISVEHMQELIDRFNSGELDIRDIIEQSYFGGRADAIDDAIHQIDNSKVNCHEDYICGINYSIGVLEGISEQLKEQSNE